MQCSRYAVSRYNSRRDSWVGLDSPYTADAAYLIPRTGSYSPYCTRALQAALFELVGEFCNVA